MLDLAPKIQANWGLPMPLRKFVSCLSVERVPCWLLALVADEPGHEQKGVSAFSVMP